MAKIVSIVLDGKVFVLGNHSAAIAMFDDDSSALELIVHALETGADGTSPISDHIFEAFRLVASNDPRLHEVNDCVDLVPQILPEPAKIVTMSLRSNLGVRVPCLLSLYLATPGSMEWHTKGEVLKTTEIPKDLLKPKNEDVSRELYDSIVQGVEGEPVPLDSPEGVNMMDEINRGTLIMPEKRPPRLGAFRVTGSATIH